MMRRHADRLIQALTEGLRTLYVPVALSICPDGEQALTHFVEKGGTLVVEACTGLFDAHDCSGRRFCLIK
jgi:hypothetical protein